MSFHPVFLSHLLFLITVTRFPVAASTTTCGFPGIVLGTPDRLKAETVDEFQCPLSGQGLRAAHDIDLGARLVIKFQCL